MPPARLQWRRNMLGRTGDHLDVRVGHPRV